MHVLCQNCCSKAVTEPSSAAHLHNFVKPKQADTLNACAAKLDNAGTRSTFQCVKDNHRADQQPAHKEGAGKQQVVCQRRLCILLPDLLHNSS